MNTGTGHEIKFTMKLQPKFEVHQFKEQLDRVETFKMRDPPEIKDLPYKSIE